MFAALCISLVQLQSILLAMEEALEESSTCQNLPSSMCEAIDIAYSSGVAMGKLLDQVLSMAKIEYVTVRLRFTDSTPCCQY